MMDNTVFDSELSNDEDDIVATHGYDVSMGELIADYDHGMTFSRFWALGFKSEDHGECM